jgi:hypothetical protein
MRGLLAGIVATIGLVLCPMLANGSDRQPELDPPDPHGAVLCVWQIYVAAAEVGNMCFPQEGGHFKDVLRESIEKMDAFIISNSPRTAEQIAEEKRRIFDSTGLSQLMARAREHEPDIPVCQSKAFGDALVLYEWMRKQDPQTMRADVAKLLAIPRKPVMNPCH